MGHDEVTLLVNFNYGEAEADHALYLIGKSDIDEAKEAIQQAYNKWFTADEGSIDDFIEEALQELGIAYEIQEYENIELDLSNY